MWASQFFHFGVSYANDLYNAGDNEMAAEACTDLLRSWFLTFMEDEQGWDGQQRQDFKVGLAHCQVFAYEGNDQFKVIAPSLANRIVLK